MMIKDVSGELVGVYIVSYEADLCSVESTRAELVGDIETVARLSCGCGVGMKMSQNIES